MKIVIFSTDLYCAGVADVVYKLAKFLNEYPCFKVSIIVYDNLPINFDLPPQVKVYRIGLPLLANFGKNKISRLMRSSFRYVLLPLGVIFFYLLKNRLQPDIIISHTPIINLISLFIKGKEKIIVVDHILLEKGLRNNPTMKYIISSFSKRLYPKSNRIIAISKPLEIFYIENIGLNPKKIVNIPNFVDLEKIFKLSNKEVESEFEEIYKYPVVVSVGRLSEQKGQWHLIRAFKKVKESLKEVKLVLVGDGELRENLVKLAKDIGINEDIHFLGWQTNPLKYVYKSETFVFPSLWEGMPLALIEAIACGIPVIATDCKSGPREILAPDTDLNSEIKHLEYAPYGILAPVPDGIWKTPEEELTEEENLLAEAMIKLLTDKEEARKYSIAAKHRSLDFSVEKLIPQWVELLNKL